MNTPVMVFAVHALLLLAWSPAIAAGEPPESPETGSPPAVSADSGQATGAGSPPVDTPAEGSLPASRPEADPAALPAVDPSLDDPSIPPPGLTRAEKLAWDAGLLIDEGQLAAAEVKATLALKVDQDSPAGRVQLARVFTRQGKWEAAERQAVEALEVDGQHMQAHYLAYRATMALGRSDEAISRIEQAVRAKPELLGLKLVYGEALLDAKRHAKAMRVAREVLKKAETSVGAMKVLARAYIAMGKPTAAKAILERAIELNKDPESHNLVAEIFLAQERIISAKNFLEEAVRRAPGYVEALNNLGVVYIKVRDFSAAQELLQRATSFAPAFWQAHLNLGSAQRGTKNFIQAETSWKHVLSLRRSTAAAWYNLGILYLENPMPGRDREKQLAAAIVAFNTYKKTRGPAAKPDPTTDKYIGEARLLLVQERQRKQEELKALEEDAADMSDDQDSDSDDGMAPDEGDTSDTQPPSEGTDSDSETSQPGPEDDASARPRPPDGASGAPDDAQPSPDDEEEDEGSQKPEEDTPPPSDAGVETSPTPNQPTEQTPDP